MSIFVLVKILLYNPVPPPYFSPRNQFEIGIIRVKLPANPSYHEAIVMDPVLIVFLLVLGLSVFPGK